MWCCVLQLSGVVSSVVKGGVVWCCVLQLSGVVSSVV